MMLLGISKGRVPLPPEGTAWYFAVLMKKMRSGLCLTIRPQSFLKTEAKGLRQCGVTCASSSILEEAGGRGQASAAPC